MKFPDIHDLIDHCEARLSAGAVEEMERERLRVSPEKTALIAEIVEWLFRGVRGR